MIRSAVQKPRPGRSTPGHEQQGPRQRRLFPVIVLALVTILAAAGFKILSHRHTSQMEAEISKRNSLEAKYLASLVDHARDELHDPQAASPLLDEATAFARAAHLSEVEADKLRRNFPATVAIPNSAQVKILTVRLSPPVLVIDFQLTGSAREPIGAIPRSQVELLCNGVRQRHVALAEVTRESKRLNVAVLLDCSGSTKGAGFEAEVLAAGKLIQSLPRSAAVRVWSFASEVKPLSSWSSDSAQLVSALKSLHPEGGTALQRAVRQAAADLATREGAKALVLFTDGRDSNPQESLDSTVTECQAKGIPIHAVGLNSADLDEVLLQTIARKTHGTYQRADHPGQLLEHFARVSETLLQPAYRLVSLGPTPPGGKWTMQVDSIPPVTLRLE